MSEVTTDRRIEFRREQAQALLDMFGGDDETVITVAPGDASSHSGPGLYAYISDYPDEGAIFLGPEGER
jgi:hypothetical protein